ncbi:hypothetical protein MBLNU230_g8266t1 [Neophaeotheca triangularis]
MAANAPLFTAVSSSARQLALLLRCISFSTKAQVRIAPDGLRFSTDEGSVMEALVLLEKGLFTSYKYNQQPRSSSEDEQAETPIFQISLHSLLETLNIFTLSDPNALKKPGDYDAFVAHRLNRHAFGNSALGVSGVCTFSYDGEGSPLSIHMSESGVATTCDLTTYEPHSTEEIPFDRDAINLKAIMRSSYLLDAVTELSSTNPSSLTIVATPETRSSPSKLSLSAAGVLGSATVDLETDALSETPVLETMHCPVKSKASFKFPLFKAAQRAMAVATKVSLRLDEESVLSLQFLVEVDSDGGDAVAFVDFRMVPLVDGEAEANEGDSDSSG